MQGMMPKPSAATPEAMVGPLTQMHLDQLTQMMLNPRPEGPPLYAVLSAITEKQKQAQAQASMQRQMAMAQGQQTAQQPPIAQQVLAQAQQAEQPSMTGQGYAGGGAVAFDDGGDIELKRLRQQIRDMFGSAASPLNILGPRAGQERQRAQEILRMLPTLDKEQMRNILGQTSRMADPAAYQEFGPGERMEQLAPAVNVPLGRGMAAERQVQQPAPRTTFDITNPASINALRIAAQDTSLPEAERAALNQRIAMMEGGVRSAAPSAPVAAPTQTVAAPANLSPEMQKMYADREAEMRRRLTRPESLVAAEQGLAALAKSNIEAQQAEAKTYGEEIRAARDAALARSQRDILSDPMALLTLAGSIDTRRGRGIGSLAQGAAGLMGQREAAAQAARKEFAQAQRDERSMQANIRQTQMLEAQRQVALEQGKLNEVNAINDKLAELGMEREKFRLTRGDKAFDQAIEGRKAAATERTARAAEISAGKPSELDVALNRPDEYARVLKARAEATQSRVSPEERRAAAMERYADNWEKLDILQKGDLAKQGVTNFQQYVRMRDQMAGVTGAAGAKTMTMADVQATATASGKTVEEVKKAAIAAGYTIQ
jgi:hypothetical protein